MQVARVSKDCVRRAIDESLAPNVPAAVYQELIAKLDEKREGPGRHRMVNPDITFNSFLTMYHEVRREQKIEADKENLPILHFNGMTFKLGGTVDERGIIRLVVLPFPAYHLGRRYMARGRVATTYMKKELMNYCCAIATLDVNDVDGVNAQLVTYELEGAKRIDIVQNCLLPLLQKHGLMLVHND